MGDPVLGEHARLSMLSTTNTSLAELLADGSDASHAAQTRLITIRIEPDAPFGIFASIPAGFSSSREASEVLREAVDQFWGTAAEAFVSRLVLQAEKDENSLKRYVASRLAHFRRRQASEGSARVQKTFALISVAAELAHRWNIFPDAWGSPVETVAAVAQDVIGIASGNKLDPLAAVRAYVERHRRFIVDFTELARPLSKLQFEESYGFVRRVQRGTEILIPSGRFQSEFPAHLEMMRALRRSRRARTEVGGQSKLTIKTPKAICENGRVYCILIDSAPANPISALPSARVERSAGRPKTSRIAARLPQRPTQRRRVR